MPLDFKNIDARCKIVVRKRSNMHRCNGDKDNAD